MQVSQNSQNTSVVDLSVVDDRNTEKNSPLKIPSFPGTVFDKKKQKIVFVDPIDIWDLDPGLTLREMLQRKGEGGGDVDGDGVVPDEEKDEVKEREAETN